MRFKRLHVAKDCEILNKKHTKYCFFEYMTLQRFAGFEMKRRHSTQNVI